MGKSKGKILLNFIIILSIILIPINIYAHSGRTDSKGGHKDNKNKSGLGSYHYHCGGNPAHLHTNGVCPYSSSPSSNKSNTPSSSSYSKSNTSSSSSSNTKTTPNIPTVIMATDIKINENIVSMKKGEKQKLTATIEPQSVTDKNINWKSSDENIATINTNGEILAKTVGTVEISASSSNGKTSTIKINVKEEKKKENVTVNSSIESKNNITNNTTKVEKENNTDLLTGVIVLGALGGSYWSYKNIKKQKISK